MREMLNAINEALEVIFAYIFEIMNEQKEWLDFN